MGNAVNGSFATRRDAELAVEHLLQEHKIERGLITIAAAGDSNTAGTEAAGADVESGHPGVDKHGDPKLAGAVEVRVDCEDGTKDKIQSALKQAGATEVRFD